MGDRGNGAPEPGEALSAVVARLRAELDGLRRAMRNRAVIEQAKGVLLERLGIAPDEAFDHLVRLSQRTNIKLAEVAAALVGTTAPDPRSADATDVFDDELRTFLARRREHPRPTTAARPPRPPEVEALQAQHQLVTTRIDAASAYDEIVQAIAETETGWTRPATVVLTTLEADGALRLVAASGLSPQIRSQWARIPPAMDFPLVAAVRHRTPVWLTDGTALRQRFPVVAALPFPHEALAVVPLLDGDRAVGALGLSWREPQTLDEPARRYLGALGERTARRVVALAADPDGRATGDEANLLPIVLDTVFDPVALLTPVYEDGRTVDFRFQHGNAAAVAFAEGERVDLANASLLALFPDVGSRVLLPELVAACESGGPHGIDEVYVAAAQEGTRASYNLTVQATRLWDGVLLAWRVRSEADLLHEHLLQAERLARVGSFWWNLRTGEQRWSPELYRLFDRSVRRGPIPLEDAARYVHEDDWLAYQDAVRNALLLGREFQVEHRLADDAGRRLRVTGEPLTDESGAVWALRGTVQDVTDEHEVEARLRATEAALAAQHRRTEAERRAAEALQRALLPTAPELATTQGLTVRGLCRSAEKTGRVAGDWYDVFALPDGATILVVGDVAGSGLPASTAAARLRHAVRAYTVLGQQPAEVLRALNTMLSHLDPDQLATLLVARYEPATHLMCWAAAGQAAPVRYRPNGEATVMASPLGLPVGAALGIDYDEAKVELAPGDRLLFYTDGLVSRRDATLVDGLEVLLHAATRTNLDDVESIVEHVIERIGSLPDDDLCVIVSRVTL